MHIVASVGPSSGRPLTSQTFADSGIPRRSETQSVPRPIPICSRLNRRQALKGVGPARVIVSVLPVYYYLDHFLEMLAFVRATYDSVLDEEHHAFFARFEMLSQDAKCLLVRMINRRGRIFDHRTFS